MKLPLCLFLLSCLCISAFGQTKDSIRVLIIYGSEPAAGYSTEYKWFGGRPGGHVVLQTGRDRVLSFAPTVYHPICHIFPSRRPADFRSSFTTKSVGAFWQTFNYTHTRKFCVDSLRQLVVSIPITSIQRKRLDSLSRAYLAHPPYDYAVVGMRCASATYEILAQVGVFGHPYTQHIWWHLLFPRDLRYELLKEARNGGVARGWRVYQTKGCAARNWDYDRSVD